MRILRIIERELLKGVQNKDKILALPEPKKLTPNDLSKLTSTIDNANTLLETSFDKLSESAVKMLQDHIKKHLNNNSEAENWIKEGLPYVNTNTCPFCGQSLDSVKDLIQSYQSFFNKEYTDFITSIDSNLDTHVYAVAIILDSEKDINEVLLSLKDYAEKIEAPEFKSAASAIGEFKAKILLVEEDITKAVAAMKAVLDECSKKKKKKPYCKIEAISKSSLINLIGQYEENLTNINEKIGIVQRHISSYKQKYRDNTAAAEVDTLIHKINACEKKKARLEQNSKCVEYSKLSKAIDDLAGEIVKLSDDINKNQSAFLDKYFAAIDSIFSELGSDKFKIEKGKPSDKGDKKVYGISVKFKDEQIPLKDLPFTFSDSDRRALALSIFWAKIKIMEADEMSKQIIVLDDPVTSFDDNRILKNNELILSFKDKVNQVILLTHYDSFVKQFYSRCNRGEGCVFLKLEQNHLTSMFEKMDIENFCCGEMEKNFSCISDFICQKSKEDVRNKLRIYFDNHLTLLFYKYLSENNLLKQDLETKINKLKEGNHITEPVREQLQTYRQMLNTDSHIFTDNNEADIRSFADGVMKLIHNIEIRALN